MISRFHDRNFFLDIEGARHQYLELLGKAAEKHDARIIGYCLMSSHVHLVLQIGNQRLGDLTRVSRGRTSLVAKHLVKRKMHHSPGTSEVH